MIVPVTFPDTVGGFQENSGLMKLEGKLLVFEFSSKDVFGVLQSDVKRISVSMSDVALFQPKFGWFGTKIVLRLNSMDLAAKFPGNNGPEVILKCKKRDRDQLKEFSAAFAVVQSDARLKRLEAEFERHEAQK